MLYNGIAFYTNSTKALGSLKWFMPTSSLLLIDYWYFDSYGSFAYKYIVSMSIKFNIKFVFPDPERPIINILYGWPGIYGQFLLCIVLFSLALSSKLHIYKNTYCFNVKC